jgi:quinol monooxygenase YgiN
MRNQTVIVAGWCTVDPKKRDKVVESFHDLMRRARNAPGCLDFAMSADPVDLDRLNLFEHWESEKDLNAWRATCKPPKAITRMLRTQVQKHVIARSGPPFSSGARRRKSQT